MNDTNKYFKLFGMIFLSIAGFLVMLLLIFLAIRLIFGFVNQLSWITYIYTLLIITLPAAIFISAFSVFFYRTKYHPSRPVKIISYILFVLFLTAWAIFYILDIISFLHSSKTQVTDYNSWNMIFLTANVACLFIVGIIQALSETKEADWLDRDTIR